MQRVLEKYPNYHYLILCVQFGFDFHVYEWFYITQPPLKMIRKILHILQLSFSVVNPHLFQSGSCFFLNADPDPESQTNMDRVSDPDPAQTLPSKKNKLSHKNVLYSGNRS
jgi:hypothetical protein